MPQRISSTSTQSATTAARSCFRRRQASPQKLDLMRVSFVALFFCFCMFLHRLYLNGLLVLRLDSGIKEAVEDIHR